MQAPVVEPVDVLRHRDLRLVDALPWTAVTDQLGLEQRVWMPAARSTLRIGSVPKWCLWAWVQATSTSVGGPVDAMAG